MAPGYLCPTKSPPSGVQKEAPEIANIIKRRTRRYTCQAERLLSTCGDTRLDFNDGQLSPATCTCFASSDWTLSALSCLRIPTMPPGYSKRDPRTVLI